jgi:hypothetical protein
LWQKGLSFHAWQFKAHVCDDKPIHLSRGWWDWLHLRKQAPGCAEERFVEAGFCHNPIFWTRRMYMEYDRKAMSSLGHDEIRQMYERLKAAFCPQCKYFRQGKNCRYMALCFAGFILDGVKPSYFAPGKE